MRLTSTFQSESLLVWSLVDIIENIGLP
jgi:hypothetical protein